MFLLIHYFYLVLEYLNNPIHNWASLIILGAFTKSTKVPFSGWIADAMTAPTPVSALLHSATMVTAGIFLIYQFWFIIQSYTICSIGCFTSIFGSFMAVFQSHMKKIIAYSTTSQLGYMMFACGLDNYLAAHFHILIHAFFKSLLFLTAGFIYHSSTNEVHIYKLSGFNQILPISYQFIILGSLSLVGWPTSSSY